MSLAEIEYPNSHVVQSYTEWQPLEEVIVGRIFNIRIPTFDVSFRLFFHENLNSGNLFVYPDFDLPNKFIEEGEEDLEGFCNVLEKAGVKVRRPHVIQAEPTVFNTPYGWRGYLTPPLNVRDQTLIYGHAIIETPPLIRTRYFENDFLKPLFYEYFRGGALWITAPKPIMTDRSFDDEYVRKISPENVPARAASSFDIGYEMMLDGAQCMRFGEDIMVNTSNENHRLGYRWLKSLLPNVRFHEISLLDSHIDACLVPLRPGTLLIDRRKVHTVDMLPPALQKWDIIWVTEEDLNLAAYEHENISLASAALDINVLSIDEQHVVVNAAATKMIRLIERSGFTPIPVTFRHGRVFGGAFHCVTLDIRRRGGRERYLD